RGHLLGGSRARQGRQCLRGRSHSDRTAAIGVQDGPAGTDGKGVAPDTPKLAKRDPGNSPGREPISTVEPYDLDGSGGVHVVSRRTPYAEQSLRGHVGHG